MTEGIYPFRRPDEQPEAPPTDVVGPVLSGEVLDPDGLVPIPVDQPHAPPAGPVWERRVERAAVVPAWVREPDTRRAAGRWALDSLWHSARYYPARLPLLALKLLAASPRGLGRTVAATARWTADTETAEQRRSIGSADPRSLVRLAEIHQARTRSRAVRVGLAAAALIAGWFVLGAAGPQGSQTLMLASVVGILGWVGRQKDKPLIAPALVNGHRPVQLTAPIILRALSAAGLGGKAAKVKDGQVIDEDTVIGTPQILSPGISRDGKGHQVVIALPYGRTFEHANAKRKEIASGLDVAQVQLFLEPMPGTERQLLMWIADSDPYVGKPNPSPLAKCPRVSVWEPQRLGVEPRGRKVALPLIFNGFVIGAIPRQGKTFIARNLIAPAILDPYCDVTVLGAKSSDWEDVEQVAVSYRAGEGDDDTVEYCVAALRQLRDECQARYDQLRDLPRDERPEGKITPALAAKGFRPHVIVLEEAQNVIGHRDSTGTKRSALAKEALFLCSYLAKVGPAAGFILVLATQRPSAEIIPADLRDILSVKIALKVQDRVSSDTILGDYRSAQGIESASLINGKHAGVAVVVGVDNGRGSDHQTIRGDLLTSADFGRICAVGRQRRIDAGTLRGRAAGEPDAIQVEVSLVADLLAVWPGTEPKVWSETLCERLAEYREDRYAGLSPETLTRLLGRHQVGVVQINRQGTNRRGYALADLQKADARC
jgi:S-DNA-T family DNA segregation ATPase FtsK/SpoIIIE